MCCEQALKVHPNNLQLLETVGALHLELGVADKAYDISYPLNPVCCDCVSVSES